MSSNISENNKRIAKNTLLLYFRMLLTMVVSLYTSRVVLATLGVDDYGIYNVVGGIVIVLSFLNNAMASATQRFLNVELGRKNIDRLKQVFVSSQLIHIGISLVILLLAETIGLWFLNSCMNIAADRMYAANCVYQFSIATFITTVLSVPYNATIIAHEKMSVFAYISIIEVLLKLLIVYLLLLITWDKLIIYAFLMFCVSLIIRLIYSIYCKRNFVECNNVNWKVEKTLMKGMLSFSSWNLFGNLGYILHTQGIAILMNIFFGTAVNAAQGIANQVNGVVRNFVNNFLTALNPQVVKTYAAGDYESMHKLVIRGCRLSYFLVAFFVVPLIIETPTILGLWLEVVPDYTTIFVRLILLLTLFDSFSSLLATAKGATGNIKKYQLILTTIGFFHLPLSALFFYLGFPPYYAMYVYLVIILILQVVRVIMVCNAIKLSKSLFFFQVVLRCVWVSIFSLFLPLLFHKYMDSSIISSIIVCLLSVVSISITALLIGFTKHERSVIVNQIYKRFKLNKE